MNINNKLFVYGTLADTEFLESAFDNISLHIKSKTSGYINARLFDLGEYPGIKTTVIQSKRVVGKIYEFDPDHLTEVFILLDDYEQFDALNEKASLYIRKITPVVSEDGTLVEAWVYWYNQPTRARKEIADGDYKKYLTRNKLNKDALK